MPLVKGKKFNSENQKLKVCAVIAAHNEELHLANCVDSLLNQSYKNLEVYIVENGSKDKTLEIAKEYEKKYSNVKVFTMGPQKGPGNPWNLGINKTKSPIIMICGADLIYGKDYVRLGLKELAKGESVGVIHREEWCHNINNLWARAFFLKRAYDGEITKVFTLIWRDYVKARPFDSSYGYNDDQTIYYKEGTEFKITDLEIYQTNPVTFKDTWEHSLWVGKSMNKKMQIKIILGLPLFPFYSLYKTIKHLKKDFYPPFLLFLPVYYTIRYFAYLVSAIKKYI